MLTRTIAIRYLFSRQSRSVVNLISGLSVFAVSMPVAAMLILLSVFNGFSTLVRSMYSAFDAELTVTPREGQTFLSSSVDTSALLRVPGVSGCTFVLEQSALLEHGDRQTTAMVRGVDTAYTAVFPVVDGATTGDSRVRIGDLDRLLVGQSKAWDLGIRTLADAEVTLYAVRRGSFSSLLPVGSYSRLRVPVGGVFSLDLETEQTYVLTSLSLARRLFDYPGQATSLALRLSDGCDVASVRQSVSALLGEAFQVRTREELRGSFYRIMAYEKWGIFFIALLVLIIASFSVVGALSMLIVEKRGDMATLRALGCDSGFIRGVFRWEGLLISFLGGLLGLLLGVVLVLLQRHFGLIEFPVDTFLTKSYPVELRIGDVAAVVLAFGGVSLLLTGITVRSMIKNEERL